MLLENAEQTASFDPYQILISFGFSAATPVPFVGLGVVKTPEISGALHEFTHQDGMHSEMGLWYLHAFWKFMARVLASKSALPLLQREQVWESYWLLSFLLEGQAMFAQLHLLPSLTLEASAPHYEFIKDLGSAYNRIDLRDFSAVTQGVARLFRDSCVAVHEQGLKHRLLTSSGSRDHYLFGYLFFRATQAYLAQFDARFGDPETFFIFICNFIFNNIFERCSGVELFDRPVGTLFHHIISAIRRVGPHAAALLEPIVSFPQHDVNYRLTNSLVYLETGRWMQRRPLDDAILALHDDIATIDKDTAQLFASSALCLQFLHLKSADVHVLGLTTEERPMLLLYCRADGQGVISGTRINPETARTIQQWAAKQGKALMNIPFPHSLRPEQIEPGLHEFAQCEMHTVRPLLGGVSFTCMTTEYDFILVHQPGPMHTLTGGDEILAARGLPTSMLDELRRTREQSLEHITDIFANDSFVRSRECRRRAMQHYLRLLQEFENVLHEHMSRPGDDRPWGDKHDPAAVRDRARDTVRRLFHLIAWSHRSPCCSAPNPIVAAVHEARLQKEFAAWCQQAPVDDAGRYRVPECPARVQATLAELFHGSFFVHEGVNITTLL